MFYVLRVLYTRVRPLGVLRIISGGLYLKAP
jgi:hypothetical protein